MRDRHNQIDIMNASPMFSIIITSYNNKELIADALASALGQTLQDFEVIVTDNCSNDGSWDVIQGFSDPKLRVYRHSRNIGMYANLNSAVSLSRGRYLKFLNSDDILHPHCLECLNEVIDACSSTLSIPIQINHDVLQAKTPNPEWKSMDFRDITDCIEEVSFLPNGLPNVCINRQRFIASGAFGHPNIKKDFSRDVLALGLSSIDAKLIFVSHALAFARIHPKQSRHAMISTKRYQLEELLFLYTQVGRLRTKEGVKDMNRLLVRHLMSSNKYLFVRVDPTYLLFVLFFSVRNPWLLFSFRP